MSSATLPTAPPGWHTVTPRLVVNDAQGQVEFLKAVFGAQGVYEKSRPSIVRIGDSILMVSQAESRSATASLLYVYVDDVAITHGRALAAGALSIEEPFPTPYGEVRCMFQDPWANLWQAAVHPATVGAASA